MSLIFPKKQPLYAPMLGTLGGGSARGFGRGRSGPPSFESLSLITTFTNSSTGRTGTIRSYTIPSDGYYSFVTRGAKGGDNTQGGQTGGSGMQITPVPAEFTAGTQLSIIVGQAGTYGTTNSQNNSGGGGGSFVWNSANNTLYVAAGGGGGASSVDYSYKNATHEINGNDGFRRASQISDPNNYDSLGGVSGQGGNHGDGDNRGGGGAGWLSNGQGGSSWLTSDLNDERTAFRPLDPSYPGRGGKGGTNTTNSGGHGGYGGGGGGGYHGTPAYGGGGGGYSGGGGGSWDGTSSGPGGGGGSYSFVDMHDYQLHSNTHGAVLIYGE